MPELASIEEGIPLPKIGKGSHPRSELGRLLKAVKHGQSFVTRMHRGTVYSLARYYGIQVAIRALDGEGELRVWRIDDEPTKTTKGKKTE